MKTSANDTRALEEALGQVFRNHDLLDQALTHASYARELESQNSAGGLPAAEFDNEQMEFLGDAVLSFVISQELFRRFPEYQEGELSKLRAHIVSARRLLRPARELKIGDNLRLGRGEERSGGRNKSALLVNALEAIIAALFLDAGLEARHSASSCKTSWSRSLPKCTSTAARGFPSWITSRRYRRPFTPAGVPRPAI